MKKLLVVLIAFIAILFSCGEKINYSLQYEVIKSEAEPKDLWLFSNRNYLLGIDPVTFEEKLVVEFNYYISNPVYIDGKIYMSEEQHIVSHPKSTHYGNQILCLNDDLTFNSPPLIFSFTENVIVPSYTVVPDSEDNVTFPLDLFTVIL